MDADRLRELAATHDLTARSLADQPDADSQKAALVEAAAAIVLYEIADELEEAA